MKVVQRLWTPDKGWNAGEDVAGINEAELVFLFGNIDCLKDQTALATIKNDYPNAILAGCSTMAEVLDTSIYELGIVATILKFEKTTLQAHEITLDDYETDFMAGKTLARKFEPHGLRHVFVLSDGIGVNGSALVDGMVAALPESTLLTGGLAGDDNLFEKTIVFLNDTHEKRRVIAVGFYGETINIGHGCFAGLSPFGPIRTITRAEGNRSMLKYDQASPSFASSARVPLGNARK